LSHEAGVSNEHALGSTNRGGFVGQTGDPIGTPQFQKLKRKQPGLRQSTLKKYNWRQKQKAGGTGYNFRFCNSKCKVKNTQGDAAAAMMRDQQAGEQTSTPGGHKKRPGSTMPPRGGNGRIVRAAAALGHAARGFFCCCRLMALCY
jgi:hypothetical protein